MNPKTVRVSVAKQFTKLPGLRYARLGPYSGEEFRQRFLIPPLSQGDSVIVELDGVRGYGSSFLDEAFGGAVRELNLDIQEALTRIKVETSVKSWELDVEEYIRTAKQKKKTPGA
jgi:STAS-like domain of unknown function (DUF4325)